jgi:hypothetical protein
MQKSIFLFALLFTFSTIAQTAPYLNFNSFINANSDEATEEELDIAYHYMVPQYEENPDPDKEIVLEFYFSEYDGSEHSKKKIEFIKSIYQDDLFENPNLNLEMIATAPHDYDIEDSDHVKEVKNLLGVNKVKYENVFEGIYFQPEAQEENKREPQNKVVNLIKNPRNYWTLIRGVSSGGAVFMGLYMAEGLSPGIAATVGLFPGIASGSITYFNGQYGNFLTNGKWTRWILESENLIAKSLRTTMGMTPKKFIKSFVENDAARARLYKQDKNFKKMVDDLYHSDPVAFKQKLFQEFAEGANKNRFGKIITVFSKMDEYIKWYATEVAFTTIALKIPQAIAGIGEAMSLIDATGHVLMGSAMGMAAQGPADLAIQLRKFQKIEELRDAIKAGKVEDLVKEMDILENGKVVGTKKVTLLEEIEMVLAKTGDHKTYTINKASHKALQRIENWARSRATMLSFFSVAGVGMEMAGIPLARPLLLGVGVVGGTYYANVKGWIKLKVPDRLKEFIEPFKLGNLKKLSMRPFLTRFCQNKYRIKP